MNLFFLELGVAGSAEEDEWMLVMCRVWKCHSVKGREVVGRSLIMGKVTNWAWMIWPMVGRKVADHEVGRKVADHLI